MEYQAAESQVDRARELADSIIIDDLTYLADQHEAEISADFDADPVALIAGYAESIALHKLQRRNKAVTKEQKRKAIDLEKIATLSEIVQTIADDPDNAAATMQMWKRIVAEG